MREPIEHDSYGELKIKGYKWFNEEQPKCIVIISHGMAETIERYDAFANVLLSHNIAVYGHSHRGHGQTAGDVSQLGILGDNGWMKMKEDLRRLVSMAKGDYPATPIVVLGHSMGSFLLRDFLLDYSMMIDGAIISGTGFMNKGLLTAAKTLAAIECKFKGTRHPSAMMDKLSFGKYNKRIDNPTTPFDWLSRDAQQVKAYMDNPYCGQLHSSGFYSDFLENLKRILYQAEFENKKESMPLFIFSGDADPVGDYGVGVKKAFEYYQKLGFKATLKLYPNGRHEMLNESNRDEVYSDVINWIQAYIMT